MASSNTETSNSSLTENLRTADLSAQENELKNDPSRVVLRNNVFGRSNGSDYIPAKWIPGYETDRKYIAAQAPVHNVEDFFDMAIQNDAKFIIVLNNKEKNEECRPYWPTEYDQDCVFDRWSVKLTRKHANEGYTKYSLKLVQKYREDIDFSFMLYHFTNWTEDDSHERKINHNSTLAIKDEINDYLHLRNNLRTPIIVHSGEDVTRAVRYCIGHEIILMEDIMKSSYLNEKMKKLMPGEVQCDE